MEKTTNSTLNSHSSKDSLNSLTQQIEKMNKISETNNNYKLQKVIGKGTYSTVYLTQSQKTDIYTSEDKVDDSDVLSKISEILIDVTAVDLNQEKSNKNNALKIIQRPNF